MSMGMEIKVFLAYAAGMLMVYIAGRYLTVPLKWAGRLAVNSIAGGAAILLINFLGENLGIFIPLNLWTAFTVGVMGLPGAVMLLVFLK